MDFIVLAMATPRSIGITMLRAWKKCTVLRQIISTCLCENSRHLRRRADVARECSWRFAGNFNESAEP
jgi:hypothetical protein